MEGLNTRNTVACQDHISPVSDPAPDAADATERCMADHLLRRAFYNRGPAGEMGHLQATVILHVQSLHILICTVQLGKAKQGHAIAWHSFCRICGPGNGMLLRMLSGLGNHLLHIDVLRASS